MRPDVKLPKRIEGKWIWLNENSTADVQHLFLRQDFTIDEMPGVAELWLAAHCHFHVIINGRPCAAGPIPHPGAGKAAYVLHVDVTPLLEVGINHVAILAHDFRTALAGVRSTLTGIWAQLDVDGDPSLWTDRNWLCARAANYLPTGLRTAPCDVDVECVDMRVSSQAWITEDFRKLKASKSLAWKEPNLVNPPTTVKGTLESMEQLPRIPELTPVQKICSEGMVEPVGATTWVVFGKGEVSGIFVGVTRVTAPQEGDCTGLFFSEAPSVLYVNGQKVFEQALPPLPVRGTVPARRHDRLQSLEFASPQITVHLQEGDNQVMLVQNCVAGSNSATFILPELLTGAFKGWEGTGGWITFGPMNSPMRLIHPNFPFEDLVKTPFIPDPISPCDPSVWYLAASFNKLEGAHADPSIPFSLEPGHFVVYDFGQTFYAFPRLALSGSSGDVLDIVCGECLGENGEVLTYLPDGRRNATTLILDKGMQEWISATPKGVRYLMVVARKTHAPVTMERVALWQEALDTETRGNFVCSSNALNEIWNTCVRTLRVTMQGVFLDSPTKDQAQILPDAMIQSRVACLAYGAWELAAQSLVSFARTQFETGEMNALSPSGLFQAVPDFSLCWPTWLQTHILFTGNNELLKSMVIPLEKLMACYDHLAIEPDGPLGDLHEKMGVYCFLDHGDIDRRGIVTGLNAIYCRALLSASWLVTQAGNHELGEVYRRRASRVAGKVHALTWDSQRHLFADAFYDGEASQKYSWQSSLLALYGGIARPEEYDEIWNTLFSDEPPFERLADSEYNNPYFKYYVLEAAFALGHRDWALKLIEHYWGGMNRAGANTWWELYTPSTPEMNLRPCAKCQGYGVSPASFLISEVAGIRPADPGMRLVYFNPLPGDVKWVNASIPTPNGLIHIEWKLGDDGSFMATINSSYPLSVVPVLSVSVAESATFSVNDKVTILAQDEE
ncbi:MAG: family 78 glycoside hydrolase catalytic domain, partial [Victivallales bacterium]|nr:family 78 glycoside hydrolase catalytic domain [Victivallales bacterium]